MTAGRPFPEVDSTRFVLVPVKDRNTAVVGLLSAVLLGVIGLWGITEALQPTTTSSGAGDGSAITTVRSSTNLDSGSGSMSGPIETIAAFLTMPTPTSTATATPVPTSTQQAVWQPEPCSTPEPGQLCRVPDSPPPTPTPYPSCYEMPEPGAWCRWIVADEAPGARQETR